MTVDRLNGRAFVRNREKENLKNNAGQQNRVFAVLAVIFLMLLKFSFLNEIVFGAAARF